VILRNDPLAITRCRAGLDPLEDSKGLSSSLELPRNGDYGNGLMMLVRRWT
jgi:hypothetical protein